MSIKIKFAQRVFSNTPALAGNVLKSPPLLKFFGPAELMSTYGNAIIPKKVTLYAHPVEIDIPDYAHIATDDLFEITVTNKNNEAINRESFRVRDKTDMLVDNIDVKLDIVNTQDVNERMHADGNGCGSHPIAYPVANKIRNVIVKYALDTLGSTGSDDSIQIVQPETTITVSGSETME